MSKIISNSPRFSSCMGRFLGPVLLLVLVLGACAVASGDSSASGGCLTPPETSSYLFAPKTHSLTLYRSLSWGCVTPSDNPTSISSLEEHDHEDFPPQAMGEAIGRRGKASTIRRGGISTMGSFVMAGNAFQGNYEELGESQRREEAYYEHSMRHQRTNSQSERRRQGTACCNSLSCTWQRATR